MHDEHLQWERAWTLVREGNDKLTDSENNHLRECHVCNDWFSTFTHLARRVGFKIAFDIPSLHLRTK
jgi:predicted anti-sigma-YlaC factor YlaD